MFLMAGIRYLIAGALMYLCLRARGAVKHDARHWLQAAILGTLLLVIGNLGVVFAEKTVPTGLVSLMVAMVPVWVALIEWIRPGGTAPSRRSGLGLLLGVTGLCVMLNPGQGRGGIIDPAGVIAVLVASIAWSVGSVYSKSARLPGSPLVLTAMEMLFAGVALLTISFFTGELHGLVLSSISMRSMLAVVYLITFGSIVAFSAYVWLLHVASPSKVATYAYVNPIVAVLLGCVFANEALTVQTMISGGIIVAAVWLITGATARKKSAKQSPAEIEPAIASHGELEDAVLVALPEAKRAS